MTEQVQRYIVMGLGRFGGGVGVVRWLAGLGRPVVVMDRAGAEELAESVDAIQDLASSGAVELRLGSDCIGPCSSGDVLVVNPAVKKPWVHEGLMAAEASGAQLTSEIELAVRGVVDRIGETGSLIAVSGSSGKSTTAAMIGAGLESAGVRVHVGGNIGGSLLTGLDKIRRGDVVVLEVSSAMLWWLDRGAEFGPDVGVLTSYAPNHLDWHGDEEHYRSCKQVLLDRTRETVVLGESVACWEVPARLTKIVARAGQAGGLRVPGRHNRLNAGMALAACCAVGGDAARVRSGIDGFAGLPHRLCRIGETGGVTFFDDSKSTTPEATVLAVGALEEAGFRRIHLIAGGYDKGVDLSALAEMGQRVASFVTIGQTGSRLDGVYCETIERAVQEVAHRARGGTDEAVLLSPGCASLDQFANYEQRGRRFAALVAEVFGCLNTD